MGRVCILTDSTAQFTRPDFPGHEHVRVVPFSFSNGGGQSSLLTPSAEEFAAEFRALGQDYDQVVAVLLSGALSPAVRHATLAAKGYGGPARVQVIDSQTTAIGLGLLVERAASVRNADMLVIERQVREALLSVYSLFCLPGLRTLARSGYLSEAQALVGEMLGLLPIFAMEEGQLSPFSKVRTQRHLLETFEEYLGEFADPVHIALVRANGHGRGHPLREFVETTFPGVPFSEHVPSPHVTALFGANSAGIVVMEGSNGRTA